MDLARFVVDAVVLEGRSYRDVASSHGVSKSWVAKLVARFREGGREAIAPRSKGANRSSAELEDRIASLRKELADQGFDAGAQTINLKRRRWRSPQRISTNRSVPEGWRATNVTVLLEEWLNTHPRAQNRSELPR